MTRSEFIDQYMNAWKAFDSPMQRQCELIADAIGLTEHDVAPVAPYGDSELVERMAQRIVHLDNARREAENLLELALKIGLQECNISYRDGHSNGVKQGFDTAYSTIRLTMTDAIARALGNK